MEFLSAQPCPKEVDIPRYMDIHRNCSAFGLEDWARGALEGVPDEKNVKNCDDCGSCEEKCPNDLPIREMFAELDALG